MASDFDHWEQLQQLFHLAEASPDADLDALLEAACADPETRARARRLIEAARHSTAILPTALPPTVRRIGPYSIVRLLGTGGIGSVYLGERLVGGAVQRVAVKVLLRSAAGPGFTERFAREQHILASLNHANITRMLDAGIADSGEPYLVMEYVDGEHLDTWCDEKQLGIAERLQLFLHVCEPVAYAHRNLVVHLDLKPSNVLVAHAEGTVKLLDFGTSKLVQPDSLLTTTVMATPAYASPEQLLNEPVTTVCDVYALGAILFELLSGTRPNRDSSVAVLIERSMKELAPESLPDAVTDEAAERRGTTGSRLRVELGGDLETIVAKSLAARPKARYATVDALMADVQRYLAGRPILARPQTTTYRIGKFVRRNRGAVVATSLALAALVATAGYATWRQQQEVRAARRAVQMQAFMSELFQMATTGYMGKPAATVPELLQLGVRILPEFIQDPTDLRAAQLNLGEAMYDNESLKDAQSLLGTVSRSAQADKDYDSEARAESLLSEIDFKLGTGNGQAMADHSFALRNSAGVSASTRIAVEDNWVENRFNRAALTGTEEGIMRQAVTEGEATHQPALDQARAMQAFASLLSQNGKEAEARMWAEKALAISSVRPYAVCDSANSLGLLANSRSFAGDNQGSLSYYSQAYDAWKQCSGPTGLNTLATQVYQARALLKLNRAGEAQTMMEGAIPLWKKTFPGSPHLSFPLVFLTRAYLQTGQFARAETSGREVLTYDDRKGNKTGNLLLAQALVGEGRVKDAKPHAQAAVDGYRKFPPNGPLEQVGADQSTALLRQITASLADAR